MSDETASPASDTDTTTEAEAPEERDERREELLGQFTEALGDGVVDSHVLPGKDLWIRVSSDAWHAAGEFARNRLHARYFGFLSVIDWLPSPFGRSMDSEVDRLLGGESVIDASADRPTEYETGFAGGDTRFQVFARVAHVGEPGNYWGVTLKADVPDEPFAVESWTTIYAGADWHEREAHEMFGVDFVGHPGLRHMYLPTGFEGHPLRKDFPLLARQAKPWPGIVDVEQMPTDDAPDDAAPDADAADAAEGADS
jgi:NADH-quinone oxidoreductase subunit C